MCGGKTISWVATDEAKTTKRVLRTALFLVLTISLIFALLFFRNSGNASNELKHINVSCVGDSITELSGYPAALQTMLGKDYSVGNFGVSGSTVSTNSKMAYIEQSAFQEAKDFQPSVVVIMLGTNDAHSYQSTIDFGTDYMNLVNEYQSLDNQPEILLVEPPPIYDNDLDLSGTKLQKDIVPVIDQIADELNLPVVDVNFALTNHPEYFIDDGVHPNPEGAVAIANEIWEAFAFNVELADVSMGELITSFTS
jgi:lysophospholipase L1-like esterase